MIQKIIFLIKSKASFEIIIFYLYQKFLNVFLKTKIKSFKKESQNFLKSKKISNDYFSMNAFNFFYYLKKYKKNFEYLEIGSFEGNSAMFVAEKFRDSKIFCVDAWVGHEQYYKDKNFNEIEKNFDFNTKNYSNIIKVKNTSDTYFNQNKNKQFDAIYIDGDHQSDQVFKDCMGAWSLLKIHGILICDDYIWSYFKDIKNNPCYAINLFLKKIKNKYKILQVSKSQIFIRKTNM